MRDGRERPLCTPERFERRAVVERRDRSSLLDRREQPILDDRGVNDDIAEVDDPVADGVRPDEVVDRSRGVALVDERELEAGRAGVDDEDVQ